MTLQPICNATAIDRFRALLAGISRPLYVLVVEDSDMDMDLTSGTVRECGAIAIPANGAHQAFNSLSNNRVDLTLLDLGLPDGDGAQVFREMKKLKPDIPIVVITGSQYGGALAQRVKDSGAELIYDKPLTVEELASLIGVFSP